MRIQQPKKRSLRLLDFDIENRPLNYVGKDFTFPDVTAIAASFTDEDEVHAWILGEVTYEEMLKGFLKLYNQADMVTGHYIRSHDLPIIQSALIEFKLPLLGPKLTVDTKSDLIPFFGISKSQEFLADLYDVVDSKYGMSQKAWRSGNRLEKRGIALAKKRVTSDVKQHKRLHRELCNHDLLTSPKMWGE